MFLSPLALSLRATRSGARRPSAPRAADRAVPSAALRRSSEKQSISAAANWSAADAFLPCRSMCGLTSAPLAERASSYAASWTVGHVRAVSWRGSSARPTAAAHRASPQIHYAQQVRCAVQRQARQPATAVLLRLAEPSSSTSARPAPSRASFSSSSRPTAAANSSSATTRRSTAQSPEPPAAGGERRVALLDGDVLDGHGRHRRSALRSRAVDVRAAATGCGGGARRRRHRGTRATRLCTRRRCGCCARDCCSSRSAEASWCTDLRAESVENEPSPRRCENTTGKRAALRGRAV